MSLQQRLARVTLVALLVMVALLGVATVSLAQDGPIRVACVGNSITFGWGIADRVYDSYPGQLRDLLGDQYDTRNFGVSRATMLKKGDLPYWKTEAFTDVLDFNPHRIVIMLGTNDSWPQNWQYKDEFFADYKAMVDTLAQLPSNPDIWACYPPPLFGDRLGSFESVITTEMIPIIEEVATVTGASVIDLHEPLLDKPELFPDGIHPDEVASRLMAAIVFRAITLTETEVVLAARMVGAGVAGPLEATGAIDADDVITPESAMAFHAFRRTARQSVPRVTLDRPASFPAEITESLHVTNATDKAMDMTVSLNDPTDGWGCTPVTRKAHLEPGDGFDLPFTLSVASGDEWVYPTPEVSALILADGQELSAKKCIVLRESYMCPQAGTVKVDGDRSDWKGVPAIVLDSRLQVARKDFRETWRGPDDLSARVMLQWTLEALYFAAEVTDDIFLQTQKPSGMWRNDCIQIAFDGKNDDTEKYGEDDSEYGLALIGGNPTLYTYFWPYAAGRKGTPSLTCAIRRNEDGKRVFYEAAVPWEDVGVSEPAAGTVFGFNLIVNDSDTGRRRGWIGWTPGIGESKAPYYFGDVMLTK